MSTTGTGTLIQAAQTMNAIGNLGESVLLSTPISGSIFVSTPIASQGSTP